MPFSNFVVKWVQRSGKNRKYCSVSLMEVILCFSDPNTSMLLWPKNYPVSLIEIRVLFSFDRNTSLFLRSKYFSVSPIEILLCFSNRNTSPLLRSKYFSASLIEILLFDWTTFLFLWSKYFYVSLIEIVLCFPDRKNSVSLIEILFCFSDKNTSLFVWSKSFSFFLSTAIHRVADKGGSRLLSKPEVVVRAFSSSVCARHCVSSQTFVCVLFNYNKSKGSCGLYSKLNVLEGKREHQKGWKVWRVRKTLG